MNQTSSVPLSVGSVKKRFGENITLMIRPYVIAREKAREEEKYKEFKHDSNVVFNMYRRDENEITRQYYLAMLYYADVVIPIFSTVAIEAAIFDKPTVSIGFDGHAKRPYYQSITRLEGLTHFKHVLETGSVKITRTFDELERLIRDYLSTPGQDEKERRLLAEKMCFKLDGNSSNRVAEFVLYQLKTELPPNKFIL